MISATHLSYCHIRLVSLLNHSLNYIQKCEISLLKFFCLELFSESVNITVVTVLHPKTYVLGIMHFLKCCELLKNIYSGVFVYRSVALA